MAAEGERDERYVLTPGRRRNMQAIRRRDTKPERALRSMLHAEGLRYRVDLRLRFGTAAVRPDIVFTRRKVAVFVDGCFWHGCPEHGRVPTVNGQYWSPKLLGNRERDARNTALLEEHGWVALRFWEHESTAEVAARVTQIVQSRP